MNQTAVLLMLVGLAVGVLIGWVVSRWLAATRSGQQAGDLNRALARAQDAEASLAGVRADATRAQLDAANARADLARQAEQGALARERIAQAEVRMQAAFAEKAAVEAAVAKAEAERDAARSQLADLRADRDELVKQFKLLSTESLEQQTKQADVVAQDRLARTQQLMTPVQDTLKAMNDRLTQVEKQRAELAVQLKEQVNVVINTSENLRRETTALSTALRKPQVRGQWGEIQLRRVVEISGMVDHCDFYTQETTQNGDATIRPDMKVMLGEGKFIYVDSKVPLPAFLDAYETTDEATRETLLKQFGGNVRSHIDQLSAKGYWKADIHTPEFVVLFIPSEALAAEALSQLPDLHEYAARRNIILATPTTLIGLLRAVAYGWQQQALAQSAAEISTLGQQLYERLGRLGNNINKLGRSLGSAVHDYNATVGTLEGRVMVSARRFRDLGVSDQELPALTQVEAGPRSLSAAELTSGMDAYGTTSADGEENSPGNLADPNLAPGDVPAGDDEASAPEQPSPPKNMGATDTTGAPEPTSMERHLHSLG